MRHQLHWSKQYDAEYKNDDTISATESEKIKNDFDKRIHALDTYKSILSKIQGLDYRFPGKIKNPDGSINYSESSQFDEEASTKGKGRSSTISEENDSKKFLESDSKDEEEVTVQQLRQLEAMLSKKCKKCMTVKVPQSHHCSICKRCVARMDHHCPWVNNCVGLYNQKLFLLFLIYVCLGSTHALVLIGWKCAVCLDDNCALFADISTALIAGLSLFLALLFDLFVIVMFCDQISCIVDHTSSKLNAPSLFPLTLFIHISHRQVAKEKRKVPAASPEFTQAANGLGERLRSLHRQHGAGL